MKTLKKVVDEQKFKVYAVRIPEYNSIYCYRVSLINTAAGLHISSVGPYTNQDLSKLVLTTIRKIEIETNNKYK